MRVMRDHLAMPERIVSMLREAISDRARFEQDRVVVDMDPMSTMRDFDLLMEDIESGLLMMSDIMGYIPPENGEGEWEDMNEPMFILGNHGFNENENWVLG